MPSGSNSDESDHKGSTPPSPVTQEIRPTVTPKSADPANAGVKIKINDEGEIELWLDWLSITFSGKFLNFESKIYDKK